jgi:hypothetical protein
LTFKIHAFEKGSSGGDRHGVSRMSLKTLIQNQLAQTTKIQFTFENGYIFPTKISYKEDVHICYTNFVKENKTKFA